ncbi:MAG: VCBS repeat-containing protein [Lentisphaerae bacterium]|nr:VCBS repeat-containing protein [Lentisphaerota bacterium]
MHKMGVPGRVMVLAAAALALALDARRAHGCIRVTYSLGRIVNESAHVSVYRVTDVNPGKNLVTYRKVRDIKGNSPDATIVMGVGYNGEFNMQGQGPAFCGKDARDYRDVMELSRVGREMVLFLSPNGNQCEICLGYYWYQALKGGSAGGSWYLFHAEPVFTLSFAGKPANLARAVEAMVAGQEVPVPCFVGQTGNWLPLLNRTARQQRIKASLKIMDYNAQRDFVSWGGDTADLRVLNGMPGFLQYGELGVMAAGPVGVAPADFTGDGKMDVCLYGPQRVALLENKDGGYSEAFAGMTGGARSAAWADYNGDGKPDLLLATPAGLKLYAGRDGEFVETTDSLPPSPYPHFTAAVWIGGNDSRPDILAADGFRGLRYYRNGTAQAGGESAAFEDVSDSVGLGLDGAAGRLKGDHLAVADVDGDGRADVLYSAGNGVLLLNTPEGFKAAPACGIRYQPGGVAPAFGDFNGDGLPDLFVPQRNAPGRLFVNEGKGLFRDATERSGALANAAGRATCAAWTDFCGRGKQDLIVGCLHGQNRYFRNNGDGTFADAGDELGFQQDIHNTSGLCVFDMNQDDVPDLVLGNTGSQSALLIGKRSRMAATEPAPAGGAAGN